MKPNKLITLITWYKFERVEFTNKKGQTVKHLDQVKMQTSRKALIDHLLGTLKLYPYHLFTARWQKRQWKNLIENLPNNHAATEMDFSENFSVTYQEEVQTQHWSKRQITIHSMVVTRPSVEADASEQSHVKEHWLVVSDDLNHDFNMVNHYM